MNGVVFWVVELHRTHLEDNCTLLHYVIVVVFVVLWRCAYTVIDTSA
jgi:hypothetical protein